MNAPTTAPTFRIVTLGCKVNQYETQAIREAMRAAGYRESREAPVDVAIVNTCVVTTRARRKAFKGIRRALKDGPRRALVVTGCLADTEADALRDMGVVVLPKRAGARIAEVLRAGGAQPPPAAQRDEAVAGADVFEMRVSAFEGHTRAFLKIEDGCDSFCSYCIVPHARGRVRSRPPADVRAEVARLVAAGHPEIVLCGIHLGHYGRDLNAVAGNAGVAQSPSAAQTIESSAQAGAPALHTHGRPHTQRPAKPAKAYYERKLPHIQSEGKTYFITFRTTHGLVLPESVRGVVLQHCIHDHEVRAWVHAAVVMPDHAHVLLTPLEDEDGRTYVLAEIMGGIKGASAHAVDQLLGRKGRVWQPESFDHILRSDESLRQKAEYICENPVRKGLAATPDDYPWLWREWEDAASGENAVAGNAGVAQSPSAAQTIESSAQAGAPALHTHGRPHAHGQVSLEDVIEEALAVPGLRRLRLSSIEVNEVSDRLVDLIADRPRLCPHLHLPLQSGDDAILGRMNRRYTAYQFMETVDRVRARVPEIGLTTDVLVGFPGETAAQFENTLSLCRRAGFSRMHVFPFSARPGTPAAEMPDRVTSQAKRGRVQAAEAVADALALAFKQRFVGRVVRPLVEHRRDRDTGLLCGYTEHYLHVLFDGPDDLMGRIIDVTAESATPSALAACWKTTGTPSHEAEEQKRRNACHCEERTE